MMSPMPGQELGDLSGIPRASRPPKLPVVLTAEPQPPVDIQPPFRRSQRGKHPIAQRVLLRGRPPGFAQLARGAAQLCRHWLGAHRLPEAIGA